MVSAALGFCACTAAILWAGTRLTAYADVIALRTRLGRVWAGMLLLAIATSLPELFNSTSAALLDLPDIAAGDICGSNVLNLAILGAIDVFSRHRTCLHDLDPFHIRSAWFVVGMSALGGAALLLGSRVPAIGWISPVSLVLLLLYFLAVHRARGREESATLGPTVPTIPLRTAVVRYLLLAGIVIIAAVLLPRFAARIAHLSGLGPTFIATVLVAVTTSLPELVTAVAAVRIDAAELAVGGIIGSNLFNLAILAVADIALWRGSLYAHADTAHVGSLVAGILLIGLFMLVLRRCPTRRLLRLTWFGWAALAVYLANAALVFLLR